MKPQETESKCESERAGGSRLIRLQFGHKMEIPGPFLSAVEEVEELFHKLLDLSVYIYTNNLWLK